MSNRAEKYLWIKQPKIQLIIFSQRNSLQAVPPFMYLVGSVQFYCWSLSLSLPLSLSLSLSFSYSKYTLLKFKMQAIILTCMSLPPLYPPIPSSSLNPHHPALLLSQAGHPQTTTKEEVFNISLEKMTGNKKGMNKSIFSRCNFLLCFFDK